MCGTINGRPLIEVVHEMSKRASILDEALTLVVEKRTALQHERAERLAEELRQCKQTQYLLRDLFQLYADFVKSIRVGDEFEEPGSPVFYRVEEAPTSAYPDIGALYKHLTPAHGSVYLQDIAGSVTVRVVEKAKRPKKKGVFRFDVAKLMKLNRRERE